MHGAGRKILRIHTAIYPLNPDITETVIGKMGHNFFPDISLTIAVKVLRFCRTVIFIVKIAIFVQGFAMCDTDFFLLTGKQRKRR